MVSYIAHLLILTLVLILLAQATDLLAGHSGRVGLGAIVSALIAGYAYALLTTRLAVPGWPAVGGALGCSLASGWVTGRMLTALEGEGYLLGTFALQLALAEFARNSETFGGTTGVRAIPAPGIPGLATDELGGALTVLVPASILSTLVLVLVLRDRSPLGRLYHWLRDDSLSAAASGVDADTLLMRASVAHAVIAGAAGIGLVVSSAYVAPDSFGLPLSLSVLTVVFLGGSGGSPIAMGVSALLVTAVGEAVAQSALPVAFVGPLQQIVLSAALAAVLVLYRRGLAGPQLELGPSSARAL